MVVPVQQLCHALRHAWADRLHRNFKVANGQISALED